MTQGLIRLQQSKQSHFVTFSCYRRQAKLTTPAICGLFLETLEKSRLQFSMRVYGYVIMPEHVHLLLSEPDSGALADALHVLKLSFAKQRRSAFGNDDDNGHFWYKRYYDRNIRSYSDFTEKLRYIHRNPVKRGLCKEPEDWPWSSFRHYALGEVGVVEIESEWTARRREGKELKVLSTGASCLPP